MIKNNLLKIILGAGLAIALSATAARAEFSLSVRPYGGGYDLDFGKIGLAASGANQELTVSIRSDINKQYRLVQTSFQPLTNSQGISIPAQNTCFFYGLRGSARNGTLSAEQETPVSFSRTIIYTSNAQGLSDQFTLVYSLKGPFQVPSGSYRGRISFSLEAVDSVVPPTTVFLNITCEVEAVSSVEIKTVDNSKVIRLDSRNPESSSYPVYFNISSGLGGQYRIIQSISELPRSNEGILLPQGAVIFQMEQIKNGSGPAQQMPLLLKPETIYQSDLNGRPDNFIQKFGLNDLSEAKAGIYETQVSYLMEETRGQQAKRLENFLLEVEIEKVFDLEFKTESGGGVISFRDINPKHPPRSFEIEVKIRTNLGKRYQVTQKVTSDLTNKSGKTIPSQYFTLRTEGLGDTKGVLKCPQKVEIRPGDTALFVSDKKGSADSFKTIYELTAAEGVVAGDYSASVIYSLSEL